MAVTGFPPGLVNGAVHAGDDAAAQAQADLITAYNDAAGRPSTPVATELGDQKFFAGVYSNSTELGLTGTVTLDAQNDPSSVWIFQAGSTLITASNSTVALANGADPCNVFWQVGSSATLGTGTTFVGTILALTSITVQTGTTVEGRALARNAAVTLDTNVFNLPDCDALPTPTDTTGTTTATTTTGTGTGTGTTTTGTGTGTGTGTTTTGTGTGTGTTTTVTGTGTTTTGTGTGTTTTGTTTTGTGTGTTTTGTGTGTTTTGTTTTGTGTGTTTTGTGTGTTTDTTTTGTGTGTDTSTSTRTTRSGGGNGGGGNNGGGNNGGGGLAFTGTTLPTMSLAGIGAGIALIGTGLVLMPRRTRAKHA